MEEPTSQDSQEDSITHPLHSPWTFWYDNQLAQGTFYRFLKYPYVLKENDLQIGEALYMKYFLFQLSRIFGESTIIYLKLVSLVKDVDSIYLEKASNQSGKINEILKEENGPLW
jgi:hypothetical protein